MNRTQLLLAKLAEEAAEVSQIALKSAQFGLEERLAGQPYTNAERVNQELTDLMAIVQMLNEEFGLGFVLDPQRVLAKMAKVNHYANYSASLGLVDQPEEDQPPQFA